MPGNDGDRAYAPIGDYALIGDCHSAALVARDGSIDWCCLPRFDSGSAFGRLLGREAAGHCSIVPTGEGPWEYARSYLDDTLVLETTLHGPAGEARLLDCFVVRDDAVGTDARRIVRVLEGIRGSVEVEVRIAPRFDYGQVRPWIRRHGHRLHSTIGGNDALLVWCEHELTEDPAHELVGRFAVGPGDRARLALTYCAPQHVDAGPPEGPDLQTIDEQLEATLRWWREWASSLRLDTPDEAAARRSGIVLKALTYAPTGAVVAAPTTSLPEAMGGVRNWDYRYAWVRDSSFSSRALAELGAVDEADAFRAFIMRSAAGHAEDLQILYGVGGERRLRGDVVEGLEGYRRSTPVRVGNDAAGQLQLDAYGELVNLTWRWHRRGHSPNDDDWRFLVSLIDHAAERWSEPDCGIWEWAGDPEHFVHSKVLCWSALDRGIRLADECMRRAPVRRWKQARDEIRDTIERRDTTRSAASTSSRSGAATWTQPCSCCRRSSTSRGTTSGCCARSRPCARTSTQATGSSTATGARTGSRATRARSCAARSGWPSAWPGPAIRTTRGRSSTRRLAAATTSDCSPRRSTPRRASSSATSRRG